MVYVFAMHDYNVTEFGIDGRHEGQVEESPMWEDKHKDFMNTTVLKDLVPPLPCPHASNS